MRKKILGFKVSIILALSWTSGNITASAHVEENGGHPGLSSANNAGKGF